MKYWLSFFFLFPVFLALGDASQITLPDGREGFFLERSDMEEAVMALEQRDILQASLDRALGNLEACGDNAEKQRLYVAQLVTRAKDAEAFADVLKWLLAIGAPAVGVVAFVAGMVIGAGL